MPPAPRAIVDVRFGPLASRKAVLDAGQAIRVGRSNLVDLSLPHDAQMSAVHCALSWDGERCLVRDLQSAMGTEKSTLEAAPGETAEAGPEWLRAVVDSLHDALYKKAFDQVFTILKSIPLDPPRPLGPDLPDPQPPDPNQGQG